MTRAVSATLRQLVYERARGCCEYCLVHESEMLIKHQPDHIIAVQHGGSSDADNLALACLYCNRNKGA